MLVKAMEKSSVISVIIPIYKVESYLKVCVESVLKQTYSNLDIILVDDGSPDLCGELCDFYAKKDARVRVIHQENQGLSGARNTGLSCARGEYLFFVDGDDFIAPHMIERLYELLLTQEADISMCSYQKVEEDAGLDITPEQKAKYSVREPRGMEEYFLSDLTEYTVVWNKLYKKSLFEHILFPLQKKVEDEFVSYKLLYEAKKVVFTEEKLYYYRDRKDSIMNQKNCQRFQHACEAYTERTSYFEEKKEGRLQSLSLYKGCYWCMRFFYASWEYDARIANWLRAWFMQNYQRLMELLPADASDEVIKEFRRFYESPEKNDKYLRKKQYRKYLREVGFCKVKAREIKRMIKNIRFLVKRRLLFLRIFFGKKITILPLGESIEQLVHSNKGIVRFGDGELSIIQHGHINFQKPNAELGKRLDYILKHPINSCYFGVLDEINMLDFDNRTEHDNRYWVRHIFRERNNWLQYLRKDTVYLSANITRPYIRYRVKTKCPQYFQSMQQLWDDRDILIVEGEESRLGVGNDLFSNAKSIERILCPAKDAFEYYDEIFVAVKKLGEGKRIFLALGPTATVLGYELCKEGYLAYDVGHIDLEYEWMLRGAYEKIKIENKYTNEVEGGDKVLGCTDEAYQRQIVRRIG